MEFTKFCNKLYIGCENAYCKFAHHENECRWGSEFAKEDVVFHKPSDAMKECRGLFPNETYGPSFIIHFDEEGDLVDEEPISISLSQMLHVEKEWKPKKMVEAKWKWIHVLRELQDALTKIDTQLATSDKWDKNE